ncbi:MAG: imidazole glycerol phosphate synthase subunit HisH [Roseomonas sp.]|nr:imidazole glycerol phosphate synthase subunit HisH [Roseomonas sp.]MCA3428750.1 imidazole glycerol phosphate synthase subunit HisH [Roseomonas sp.]MCA3431940.1 imidazole glycerol phosphate synthase subunit HisH [Roseomonas sp.]
MKLVIIDPGSGNLASVKRAFQKVAGEAGVAAEISVTRDAAEILAADRVVLPGQGAFAACRRGLDALPGAVAAMEKRVRGDGVPFLGICVGMQLMATQGLEHGSTPGLDWLPGKVAPMDPKGADGQPLPLPQMGWNALAFSPGCHPLLAGIVPGDQVYFVHSYAFTAAEAGDVIATTDYGGAVTAAIARHNLAGLQFHVEKSGPVGLRILANFLQWVP